MLPSCFCFRLDLFPKHSWRRWNFPMFSQNRAALPPSEILLAKSRGIYRFVEVKICLYLYYIYQSLPCFERHKKFSLIIIMKCTVHRTFASIPNPVVIICLCYRWHCAWATASRQQLVSWTVWQPSRNLSRDPRSGTRQSRTCRKHYYHFYCISMCRGASTWA